MVRQLPSTAVLSMNEIIPEIDIEAMGTVVMNED